ncbi:MAG: InlB B-repeat-containing protein, partial [Candidatus Nanopelagicales bacterium]
MTAVLVAAATLIAVSVSPASAASGDRDPSFTPLTLNSFVSSVTELTVAPNAGKYLIGGFFTDAGGDAATDYVARLNADGTRDTSFAPLTLNGTVESVTELTVAPNAGKYLIGGFFTDAGGDATTDYVARLNADGTRDTSFTPLTLDSAVYSVAEVDAGQYLIGGQFADAGGDAATDYVARLDADGTRDTSFTPLTLNGFVFSVTGLTVGADAGKYLVGGLFTDAGGDAATDFAARLNADGTRDTSFTPLTLNNNVRSVTELSVGADAGKYLVGGPFTDAGGDAATDYVARLNADGTRDTSFTPLSLSDPVYSVTGLTVGAEAGKFLVGGFFTDAGGDAATDYVARLNADGTRDTSFTPLTLSSSVISVTELAEGPNAGKYLIGGAFTNAGGDSATNHVARLLAQSPTYTVTFDNNGGSGSMANQVANVATPLDANTFSRAGYSFTGWNTADDGSGTNYADGATFPFTADATLYAQWSALPNHTVTFDNNGGSGSMANQVANVATPLDANTFTRAGYTFDHWNT